MQSPTAHGALLSEPDDAASFATSRARKNDDWAAGRLVAVPEGDGDDDAGFAALPWWRRVSARKLWAFMGPGFFMSIAYMDPDNIEGDAQSGGSAGYTLLWVLLWSTLAGILVQVLALRLGCVTMKGLAQHSAETYPRWVQIVLWVLAELAVAGADCQEVIGSAIGIYLLSGGAVPMWGGCIVTVVDVFAFMFLAEAGVRKLEAFFGVFISTMVVCFAVQYFARPPPQGEMWYGTIVPRITSTDNLITAVGVIGSAISPYNLYLHGCLVQSRDIKATQAAVDEAVLYNTLETFIALMISFLLNLFITGVFANLDYSKCSVSADDIGIASAGPCLAANYADWAKYVFAAGILASGQASCISLTYAGQFIMAGFLRIRMVPWKRVIFSRAIALIPALAVCAIVGDSPDDDASSGAGAPGSDSGSGSESADPVDKLSDILNILQCLLLPFVIVTLLYFTDRSKYMERDGYAGYTNGRCMSWLVWALTLVLTGMNVYAVIDTVQEYFPDTAGTWVVTALILVAYAAMLGYLVLYNFNVLAPVGGAAGKQEVLVNP